MIWSVLIGSFLLQSTNPLGYEDVFLRDKHFSYSIKNGNNRVAITEYEVVNNSKEAVYTWIDYNNSTKDNQWKTALKRFVWKGPPGGHICLGTLLYDNTTFDGYYPYVGFSFLKRIEPHKSFWYIVIGDPEFIKHHIFYMKESETSPHIVYSGNIELILFKNNYIVLRNTKSP